MDQLVQVQDFGPWDLFDRFTIDEASALWLGYNPYESDFQDLQLNLQIEAIRLAMRRAFDSGQLIVDFRLYDDVDGVQCEDWGGSIVLRKDLVSWAISRGSVPLFLSKDTSPRGSAAARSDSPLPESPDPLTTYTTPMLSILRRAVERFWLSYDPANPPKSPTIISWLKEQGLSQRSAEAVDLIIRPDERRRGGQTKAANDD